MRNVLPRPGWLVHFDTATEHIHIALNDGQPQTSVSVTFSTRRVRLDRSAGKYVLVLPRSCRRRWPGLRCKANHCFVQRKPGQNRQGRLYCTSVIEQVDEDVAELSRIRVAQHRWHRCTEGNLLLFCQPVRPCECSPSTSAARSNQCRRTWSTPASSRAKASTRSARWRSCRPSPLTVLQSGTVFLSAARSP
jgi:hypothetical protein